MLLSGGQRVNTFCLSPFSVSNLGRHVPSHLSSFPVHLSFGVLVNASLAGPVLLVRWL